LAVTDKIMAEIQKIYILPQNTTAMRKFFLVFLSGLLLSTLVRAQDESVDTVMIGKIREEGLQRSQVRYIAHNITDVAGSRLTNSPGFKRAAAWIVSTLQGWGLSNAQTEAWGEFGYGWDLEHSYAAMKAPYYSTFIAYPAPWSGSTSGLVEASVFLAQRMDSAYIAQNADKIRGHVLLYKSPDSVLPGAYKPEASRYTDGELAKQGDTYMLNPEMLKFFIPQIVKQQLVKKLIQNSGALAVLEMSRGGRDGTVFVDGFGGYRKGDQPALPTLIVAKEDYQKMERLLEGGAEVKVELDIKAKLYTDDLKGHDVIAEIPGTDPTLKAEVVMLGGHLDSWQSATGLRITERAALSPSRRCVS